MVSGFYGASSENQFLMGLAEDLTIQWTYVYAMPSLAPITIVDIEITSADEVVMGGQLPLAGNSILFFGKTDSTGILTWMNVYFDANFQTGL